MSPDQFRQRTKSFAAQIIKRVDPLSESRSTTVLARPWVRSGTSGGANYRAAWRAMPRADFTSKLGMAEEACDESLDWMALLMESGKATAAQRSPLTRAAHEILARACASLDTARRPAHPPSAI